MDKRLMAWMVSRDTGRSSESIVAFMEGVKPERGYDYPRDPSDLGRCLRLLKIMPEYMDRLDEMKAASDEWCVLIEHWNEIKYLYYKEYPNHKYDITYKATDCYKRMRNLIMEAQGIK